MTVWYFYLLINLIGTYTSYLAVVAVPGQTKHFLFNLGVFFAARNLGSTLAYFAASRLINRFSERRCLISGNVVSGLAMLSVMLVLHNIALVALLMLCVGFGDNLLSAALNSHTSKSIPREKLLHFNHNLQIITYLTMIIGATIGGSIIQYNGLKPALFFDGATYLVCAGIAVFLGSGAASSGDSPAGKSFSLWAADLRPQIRMLLGLEVCCALIVGTFNLVEIPYYLHNLGLKYSQIGLYFSVTIFGLLAAKLLSAKHKLENIKLRRFMLVHLVYAAAFLGLSFSSSLVVSGLMLAVFIGTLSLSSSISTYFFQTWSTQAERPRLLSMKVSLNKSVVILITILSGYFSDRYDILTVMRVAFIGFVLIMAGIFYRTFSGEEAYEQPA